MVGQSVRPSWRFGLGLPNLLELGYHGTLTLTLTLALTPTLTLTQVRVPQPRAHGVAAVLRGAHGARAAAEGPARHHAREGRPEAGAAEAADHAVGRRGVPRGEES